MTPRDVHPTWRFYNPFTGLRAEIVFRFKRYHARHRFSKVQFDRLEEAVDYLKKLGYR